MKEIKNEIKIELRAMRFYASHGCYATEKRVGGRFEVSVTYSYDRGTVEVHDDVTRAVNYLDVYDEVRQQMAISSDTIEHVAYRICLALFDRCSAMESVEVSVTKITPPLGGDIAGVSATLSLRRDCVETHSTFGTLKGVK